MIFIVVRSRRRTSSKGSAALWLDAQVNPHVLHRTGATTYLFISFGRRNGPPASTHAPLRPKERPPRAPSSCSSKRSAPPPTCEWPRKASSKINPSRFTQAATRRTTTWTCQHEPWTVVVVVARDVDERDARKGANVSSAWISDSRVAERMGCIDKSEVRGDEFLRGNVMKRKGSFAKRVGRDPGRISTSHLVAEIVHRRGIGLYIGETLRLCFSRNAIAMVGEKPFPRG